jgi:hypothetical protein
MRPEERIRRMRPEHTDGTRSSRAKKRAQERRAQRALKFS